MRWISLLLTILVCPIYGQQGGQQRDLDELRQRLAEVLSNQRQLLRNNDELKQSNADLRARVDQLDRTVGDLRIHNDELSLAAKASLEDDLAQHVNGLLQEGATPVAFRVTSAAQALNLTGEFRFRTTAMTGIDPRPVVPIDEFDGFWTDARVRLGFDFRVAKRATAFLELQSHWGFGDGLPSEGSGSGLPLFNFGEVTTDVDLYQAHFTLEHFLGAEELTARFGRQEVVKGRMLHLGNAEFFNGWVFDGSRLDYDSDDVTLTAMAFKLGSSDRDLNQLGSVFTPHDDDELYGLYFTYKGIENHEIDLYWLYVNGHGGSMTGGSGTTTGSLGLTVGGGGLALGTTAYYHTFGARIGGVFADVAAGLDYSIEAAFQTGNVNGSPVGISNIKGFVLDALLGVTLEGDARMRPFLRVAWASGPEDGDSGFVPLYYGRVSNAPGTALEYLYGINALLPPVDVFSIQGGMSFFFDPQWAAAVQAIWARTDEKIFAGDSELGVEFDVGVSHFYSQHVSFTLSMSILMPGDQYQGLFLVGDDTVYALTLQSRLRF